MKTLLLLLAPLLASAQSCYDLRGKSDAATIEALTRMLDDGENFTCAAANLRIAGAVEALKHGLASENPQIRAAAAREIGSFQKSELLDALSRAAGDPNVLVATNALAGLSQYGTPDVVPHLAELASRGGMIGDMALDRLHQLDPVRALQIARQLLGSAQVPDKLYALRVIGASGDSSDLPALRAIAAAGQENLTQRNRGFGLMPPVNLARAARAAIEAIQKGG